MVASDEGTTSLTSQVHILMVVALKFDIGFKFGHVGVGFGFGADALGSR